MRKSLTHPQKKPQQTLSHLVTPGPPFSPRCQQRHRHLCRLAGLLGPSGRPNEITFLRPTVMVPARWGSYSFYHDFAAVPRQFSTIFYLTSKTWSSGPGQNSMALPVNILSGVGVLEYWSIGLSEQGRKVKQKTAH